MKRQAKRARFAHRVRLLRQQAEAWRQMMFTTNEIMADIVFVPAPPGPLKYTRTPLPQAYWRMVGRDA